MMSAVTDLCGKNKLKFIMFLELKKTIFNNIPNNAFATLANIFKCFYAEQCSQKF